MDSLLELSKRLADIRLIGETNHNVKFLQLHIDRVIVFNKKYFQLVLEDIRSEKDQLHVLMTLTDPPINWLHQLPAEYTLIKG